MERNKTIATTSNEKKFPILRGIIEAKGLSASLSV